MTEQSSNPYLTHILKASDNKVVENCLIAGEIRQISILSGKHTHEYSGNEGFSIFASNYSKVGAEKTGLFVTLYYSTRYKSDPDVICVTEFINGESMGTDTFIIEDPGSIQNIEEAKLAVEFVLFIMTTLELVSVDD